MDRKHFTTSRELDFLSIKELTSQTGHSPEEWPLVILKELLDNALDICEEKNVVPEIVVEVNGDSGTGILITDNGPGIPSNVINGVLDLTTRISSREAYVAPDRGAQGNALKTIVPMPSTLFGAGHVVIVACGVRHEISVEVDQVKQKPVVSHQKTDVGETFGTSIFVEFAEGKASVFEDESCKLPSEEDDDGFDRDEAIHILDDSKLDFIALADAFCWLNPHLKMTVTWGGETVLDRERTNGGWQKWLPSNPTDPHWYNQERIRRSISAHVSSFKDMTVREYVSTFRGLSSSAKQKKVLEACELSKAKLVDLIDGKRFRNSLVQSLLGAMKANVRKTKTRGVAKLLGVIGEPHLKQYCEAAGGQMDSFKYKQVPVVMDDGVPYVLEVAFCFCPEKVKRTLVLGVNWSPGIGNPFRNLGCGKTLDGILTQYYADRERSIVFAMHVACPVAGFKDRGKSSLSIKPLTETDIENQKRKG